MLQVSSNLVHNICNVSAAQCNVFQSVASMVPATQQPQRISAVCESFPSWGGLLGHSARALPV